MTSVLLEHGSSVRIPSQQGEKKRTLFSAMNDRSYHNTTDNDATLRASSGMPEELEDGPGIPDITVLCKDCNNYIDLQSLAEHRYYHTCLKVMKYTKDTRPQNLEKLLIRRKNLIRQLKAKTESGKLLDPRPLQRINEAYEFLKADLEDTFEMYRQIREDISIEVEGIGLNCSADCALAVGICCHGNSRWKRDMEDTKVFQDYFGNDPHKCYFGIYDGHNGHFAAETTARELHHILLMEMAKFDPATACICAELDAEEIHGEVMNHKSKNNHRDRFCEIHSRTISRQGHTESFHEESAVMLHKIMQDYSYKVDKLLKTHKRSAGSKERDFSHKMSESFKRAHCFMDLLLSWGKEEYSRVRWSGCSTLCCVVHDKIEAEGALSSQDADDGQAGLDEQEESENCQSDNKPSEKLKHLGNIYLANAGNVQAVLVRGNKAHKLSQLHDATNEKEYARVIKEGGKISKSERELKVNGILTATRGLGNQGDPALRKCVICRPHTVSVKIDQYCQFLVLATHGVWECFSPDEAASVLIQMMPLNFISPSSHLATSVYNLFAANSRQVLSRSQTRQNKPFSATTRTTGGTQQDSDESSINTEDEKLTDLISRDDDLESARALEAQMTSADEGDLSDNDLDLDDVYNEEEGQVQTKEEMQREYAKAMSERLTQAALLAGAKDNITVVVVLLPGSGL